LIGSAALSVLIVALRAKRIRIRHGSTEATIETAAPGGREE